MHFCGEVIVLGSFRTVLKEMDKEQKDLIVEFEKAIFPRSAENKDSIDFKGIMRAMFLVMGVSGWLLLYGVCVVLKLDHRPTPFKEFIGNEMEIVIYSPISILTFAFSRLLFNTIFGSA